MAKEKKPKKVGVRELEQAFREAADAYVEEGILEIDQPAKVSISVDDDGPLGGAYVQMWQYVHVGELPRELFARLRAEGRVRK